MTAAVWLALALTSVAIPAPASAALRAGALAEGGRLVPRAIRAEQRGSARRHGAVLAAAVTLVVAAALYLTAGTALAIAASAVAAALWLVARDLARRRESSATRAELRAALRVLVGELEVGTGAAAALAGAAEVAPRCSGTLRAAAVAAASGADPAAALAESPALRTLALAWHIGADTGIALAGVLARVEADLAAVDEQRRAVSVALAGPRASAVVLAALPLLGLGLGAAMGARPWTFLCHSNAGQIVCCVGVLLDVAGVLWLRAVLRRAESS